MKVIVSRLNEGVPHRGTSYFAAIGIAVLLQQGSVGAEQETPETQPSPPGETIGAIPTPSESPGVTPAPDSLFVPVVPGATPTPPAFPASTPRTFVPSEIPQPVFQSTPEATDITVGGQEILTTPTGTTARPLTVPSTVTTPSASPSPTPRPRTTTPARRPAPTTEVSQAISGERLNQMMSQARTRRDAKLATQVGWALFNRKDYASAAMWFEQAIGWNTDLGEAYYGLALTKFTQGDTSQAEAIAGYRLNSYPKMKTLMGDILIRRAMEDYEARQYAKALDALNRASEYRALTRAEQIMRGWSFYYLKDFQSSANVFERLYRAKPDRNSAEGLYAALARMKDWERIELVASEVPGPLNEIYMTYDTERFYKAGLYLAAYAANEKAYPALQNIDSASLAVGLEYRYKSGDSGTSQLQTTRLPVGQLKLYPIEKLQVTAEVAYLQLQSGAAPSRGAFIGTPPDGEKFQRDVDRAVAQNRPIPDDPFNYKNRPTTNFNNLFEWKVRAEYQDWFTPYIEIGSTPLNADIGPMVTGRLGVEYRHPSGYVQVEGYSQSIRESILSYVGMQDPYSSRQWGRVQETGISASVFQGFLENYTFFAEGSFGVITGVNTKQNEHLRLVASASRLFNFPGFEYVTIGPAVSYEHYSNNQNFFTYGHGGYFSPDYIIQGIIEAQALTTEGQPWLVGASMGGGIQNNFQAGAPVLPLDPDGRNYSSTSSTTGIFLVSADGGFLVTPNWMVGSRLSYSVTADYNEGFASIYVRYFFEPRAGLFRSDLDSSFW